MYRLYSDSGKELAKEFDDSKDYLIEYFERTIRTADDYYEPKEAYRLVLKCREYIEEIEDIDSDEDLKKYLDKKFSDYFSYKKDKNEN